MATPKQPRPKFRRKKVPKNMNDLLFDCNYKYRHHYVISLRIFMVSLCFFLFFLFLSLQLDNHLNLNWTSIFCFPLIPLFFPIAYETKLIIMSKCKKLKNFILWIVLIAVAMTFYLPFMATLNKVNDNWFYVFIPYYFLFTIIIITCIIFLVKTIFYPISVHHNITHYGSVNFTYILLIGR